MLTIRMGSASSVVATERIGEDRTVYVPECCSRRYLSLRGLGASHVRGCPVDHAIRELFDGWGESRVS
jgi:hypothetical protein